MTEFNRNQAAQSGPAPGDTVAAAVMREAQAWASTQGELFLGIEAIWADWLKRQGEAIDAAARSLQQMCECRNVADLVQVQQQWLADTVRRTTSDIGALTSEALAVTRRVGRADRFGAGARSQMPARATPPAKSAESGPVQRAAA